MFRNLIFLFWPSLCACNKFALFALFIGWSFWYDRQPESKKYSGIFGTVYYSDRRYGIDSVSEFLWIAGIMEVPSRNGTAAWFLGHCVRVDQMLLIYSKSRTCLLVVHTWA
jgi:hypothetical protein